jgi:hypothetical protein
MIAKYWQVFNASQMTATGESMNPFPYRNSSSSDETAGSADMNDISNLNISSMSNSNSFYQNSNKSHLPVVRLDRMGFNVVHPFNNSNMISEKVSQRRLAKISKAFQIGAANLSILLKRTMDGSKDSFSGCLRSYFPVVYARFSEFWRPDAIGNVVKLNPTARYID